MHILILGGGGREHAIVRKLSESRRKKKLFIAPGNAGTADLAETADVDPADFNALAKWAVENRIDLIIPGPEQPVVDGLREFLEQKRETRSIKVLSPDKEAAGLEGSKAAAKRFMYQNKVPTAAYATFSQDDYQQALEFVRNHDLPIVIKADGLAAGKGVLICQSQEEAEAGLKKIFIDREFGRAGETVVIEEFLRGNEVSVFILTDGKNWKMLPDARDYKRAGKGGTGPNTGGMGAVSPSGADDAFMEKVTNRIIKPTLRGIEIQGWKYCGFLFFGLINVNGNPFVLEYNVRLGDPETQAILPRLDEDLLALCSDASKGKLSAGNPKINPDAACAVVMASGGYPGKYEKGKVISGLDGIKGSTVYHAGTALNEKGEVITSGGRVLAVTSLGKSPADARKKSYETVEKIDFENRMFRTDIGL